VEDHNKIKWADNLPRERHFWRGVISGRNPSHSENFTKRAAGQRPFPAILHEHLAGLTSARILDVGAGPATDIGRQGMPDNVEVVAVDPLAGFYNQILEENGVLPWLKTIQGEAELLQELNLGRFDVVYSRNALDHAYDPAKAIVSMLSVLQPSGVIILIGNVNEGERQNYSGLHQWNFLPQADGDLAIWRPDSRISLRSHLGDTATVNASGDRWYRVVIRNTQSS